MKKEQLIELGIDEETAKKVLDINGGDIENAKTVATEKATSAEGERDALRAQLEAANEAMKGFEGIDPANLQDELTKAQQALRDAQENYTKDIAARDRRAETERFLSDKKFINDITRTHFIDQTEVALSDPVYEGKNRQDILDALTLDKDGDLKPGIFAAEVKHQLLDTPPSGDADEMPTDEFQKRIDKYRRNN